MKRREFNDLELLILADIANHPGSTQGQVIARLMAHYKSRSYIQTMITRLVARGKIANEGNEQAACYMCR